MNWNTSISTAVLYLLSGDKNKYVIFKSKGKFKNEYIIAVDERK